MGKEKVYLLKKIIWPISLIALVVAVYFVSGAYFFRGNKEGLPGYALENEQVKEAYLFAKENPFALEGINCYCGCMQHPHGGRIHAKGLHDCFRNNNGFEIHGSQCDMCINDALQIKHLAVQNKSKSEIKKIVEEKYK